MNTQLRKLRSIWKSLRSFRVTADFLQIWAKTRHVMSSQRTFSQSALGFACVGRDCDRPCKKATKKTSKSYSSCKFTDLNAKIACIVNIINKGCLRREEPTKVKLHVLHFGFIVHNMYATCSSFMLYRFSQPLYLAFADFSQPIWIDIFEIYMIHIGFCLFKRHV